MSEKLCFIVAVQSSCSIRVRIMVVAVVLVWAGFAVGGKMSAIGEKFKDKKGSFYLLESQKLFVAINKKDNTNLGVWNT